MHWIDACNKSKVNTAVRQKNLIIQMFRYSDGTGAIKENGKEIRKALRYELKGYLDWEPYE